MAVPTLAPVDLAPSTPTSSPVNPVATPVGQAGTPAPATQVANPVPAAPVVTEASLRADYDRLVAEVRANFAKEK